MRNLILILLLFVAGQGSAQILIDKGVILNGQSSSFNLMPYKWNQNIITYSFSNGTNDIPGTTEHDIVRQAMQKWEQYANMKFIETCNPADADLKIFWAYKDHGDYPFDSEVAHTIVDFYSFATKAEIHINDGNTWTSNYRNNGNDPKDLMSVILHELGHVLGLDHVADHASFMFPMYEKSKRDLTQDEINGISTLYGPKIPIAIEGDDIICSSGLYSLPQYSTGKPIQWTAFPANIVSLASYGANGIQLQKLTSGTVSLTATICGAVIASKSVTVGTPKPEGISGLVNGQQFCTPGYYTFTVAPVVQGANYEWFGGAGTIVTGQGTSSIMIHMEPSFASPQSFNLAVKAKYPCGDSEFLSLSGASVNCSASESITVFPNPGADEIDIKWAQSFATVTLFDLAGNLMRKEDISNKRAATINVSALPNGIYTLIMTNDKEVVKKLLIVQH